MVGIAKTHEKFIEELREKNSKAHEELKFLEKYKGINDKIKAITKYGEVLVRPNSLLKGHPISIESAINKTEYLKNMLKNKNAKAYKELEFLEEYKGNHKKIRGKDKYGEVYVTPSSLLRGSITSIETAIDKNEYFSNQAIEKHGKKYNYNKVNYKGSNTKIKIYCKKCKKYFWQTPKGHLSEQGCPRCRTSKGEEAIEKHLLKNNINFKSQKRFNGCKYKKPLPFDFYLPENNICIEFDGIQHFKPVKRFGGEEVFKEQILKDLIKTEYCRDNGIELIRIPYTDFEKIEEILKRLLT